MGGDGAARIKLDVPASEVANALKLIMLKDQAFKVTIETLQEDR